MADRLYTLRPDQELFETGTAQGKQLLLAVSVSEISLHWFSPEGEFLELQRMPVDRAILPTGHRQWRDGKLVSEGLDWEQRVKRQLSALKERFGFVACTIAIRKFESEAAGIFDLLGDYVQFLENRAAYSVEDQQAFDEYIRKWHQAKDFVLAFDSGEYWMTESGEVASS